MDADPRTVLTESDVDVFGSRQLGASVLDGNIHRCQTDECIRTKILATLYYRSRPLWQSFILERYLSAARNAKAEEVSRGALRIHDVFLSEWDTAGRWFCTERTPVRPVYGDALYVLRVEMRPLDGDFTNAVVVFRAGRMVVFPFGDASAAAAGRVPWGSLFDEFTPAVTVKIQPHERPWVSLLWLHAALTRFPGCDVLRSIEQDVNLQRPTSIFEFHVCDELVPPLRRRKDMRTLHLEPFARERTAYLQSTMFTRELVRIGPIPPFKGINRAVVRNAALT